MSSILKSPIVTTDDATGAVEHTVYMIFIPASASDAWDIPYSSLVPSGETKQIHITDTYVALNPNSSNVFVGGCDLLLESPSGSENWKINLGHGNSLQPKDRTHFDPGVIMSSGDNLCFDGWSGSSATASIVQASLKYTIA